MNCHDAVIGKIGRQFPFQDRQKSLESPFFVALEGLDGTGKSTVLPLIEAALKTAGLRVATKPEFPEGRLDIEFRDALCRGLFLAEHLDMAPPAAFFYLLYADTYALTQMKTSSVDVILADRCHFTQSMYQARFAASPPESLDVLTIKRVLEQLYQMFGLPTPDTIFILDAPWDMIIERLETREGRQVTSSEQATLRVFESAYRQLSLDSVAEAVEASDSPTLVAHRIATRIIAKLQG